MKRRDAATGYLMVAPAVIMLCIFVIVPLFMAVQYSFYNVSWYLESDYVGFENFKQILRTTVFRQSLGNALRFVVINVPSIVIISFLVANMLAGLRKGFSTIVKTSIYIPGIVAGIAIGLVFNFIFNYNAGIVNQVLHSWGMDKISFYTIPLNAILSIAGVSLWMALGGTVILMYAARVNVPGEFYEAASIDGANAFQKLIYITIPQMKNIFILVAISGVTGTVQMFDLPFIMTLGGPVNKTLTPMLYLFNQYRDPNKTLGYTVAGALVIMVFISIINSFIFSIIRSEKSIEG